MTTKSAVSVIKSQESQLAREKAKLVDDMRRASARLLEAAKAIEAGGAVPTSGVLQMLGLDIERSCAKVAAYSDAIRTMNEVLAEAVFVAPEV